MSKEVSLTSVLLVSLAVCVPALLTYGELAPVVDDAEVYMEEEANEVALNSCPVHRLSGPVTQSP
jgi:hypothetical protein